MQTEGLLGCFGLTEKHAGVSSGLVVRMLPQSLIPANPPPTVSYPEPNHPTRQPLVCPLLNQSVHEAIMLIMHDAWNGCTNNQVEATADYDPHTRGFTLNTTEEGAAKNWISSGLVADKTVVVANLRINGESYGPHAFLVDMRINGPWLQHPNELAPATNKPCKSSSDSRESGVRMNRRTAVG